LHIRTGRGDALLLAGLALTVVAALPAVGALLVGTLLVVPAATARLLTDRLRTLQLLAVTLAAAEGVGGLLLAYQYDLPPGPAIALLGGAAYALAAVAATKR
ncbi:MAG TPA: metal ABC transporter permease, partial [Solirubrobacteraceae bacterium]|nr:metal ABC transporter permease [Solirubrobacteraceae bacterium]